MSDINIRAFSKSVSIYEKYYGKGNVRFRFENYGTSLVLRFYRVLKETEFTEVVQETQLIEYATGVQTIDMADIRKPRRVYKHSETSYVHNSLKGALRQFLYRKRKEARILQNRYENNKIVSGRCKTLANDLGLQTLYDNIIDTKSSKIDFSLK